MQVDVACVTVRNNGPFVIVLVASELDSIVDQGATLPSATLTSRHSRGGGLDSERDMCVVSRTHFRNKHQDIWKNWPLLNGAERENFPLNAQLHI